MSKEFDDYKSDVVFDVWMRGGNIDAIDDDEIRDLYDDGFYQEEAAYLILRKQRYREEV